VAERIGGGVFAVTALAQPEPPADTQGLGLLREFLLGRFGLTFDPSKNDFLSTTLRRRVDGGGFQTAAQYLARLASSPVKDPELGGLMEDVTVSETYFFREPAHLQALVGEVLPNRMRARSAERCLRILSAGCASGEELYSLAILLKQAAPALASWELSFLGVDINAAMIRKARLGRYSPWSLRGTSAELKDRFFRPAGGDFLVDEEVRQGVSFEQRNLFEEDAALWAPRTFDVVFCRNVTMYFSLHASRRLISRIARSLAPGGYLFLGHVETLRGVSSDFHLRHSHDTFFYQLRSGSAVATSQPCGGASAGAPTVPTPPGEPLEPPAGPLVSDDASWVDVIRGASERIARLADGSARSLTQVPRSGAAHPPEATPLSDALGLLKEERFTQALERLAREPEEPSSSSPEVQLLRAVLLTNEGKLSESEAACRTLLEQDELNAGARYVLALCREHAGDFDGAAEHDETAAYLDPTFSMPRLHRGLLARRTGQLARAREEFERALDLLEREDPSRLLLFGGGFGREALVRACRAELEAGRDHT
jgi:chemotaxis protein methyltransferase CheR